MHSPFVCSCRQTAALLLAGCAALLLAGAASDRPDPVRRLRSVASQARIIVRASQERASGTAGDFSLVDHGDRWSPEADRSVNSGEPDPAPAITPKVGCAGSACAARFPRSLEPLHFFPPASLRLPDSRGPPRA